MKRGGEKKRERERVREDVNSKIKKKKKIEWKQICEKGSERIRASPEKKIKEGSQRRVCLIKLKNSWMLLFIIDVAFDSQRIFEHVRN